MVTQKPEHRFYNFLAQFGEINTRSMFGGIGFFENEAMYALLRNGCLYIRGGQALDDTLLQLGCGKYRHVKKQSTATVNYYDITELYLHNRTLCEQLVRQSKSMAIEQREDKRSPSSLRLRDLPNLNFTLERMMKKSGVNGVDELMELGAAKVFQLMQQTYGPDIDQKTLLKLIGAIKGQHWELIPDNEKEAMLSISCQSVC